MIGLQGQSQIMNNDETLTVYREITAVTPQYVDGRLVTLGETSFPVYGNVQPLNGRDLLMVPEADRSKEQFWLYVQDQTELAMNDRVVRNETSYYVQSVDDWGSYTRARIMGVDVGTNR